jgi:hypothetical protein
MGEREVSEHRATVRAALAKLEAAVALNGALENQIAHAYADLKTMSEVLDEARTELRHLNGRPAPP